MSLSSLGLENEPGRMPMARAGAKRHESPPAKGVRVLRGGRRTRANPHRGPSVESFLREEGLYEKASARAIKEVLVFQIEEAMKREGLTKAEMARRMGTSRSALDRLLDSENESVTLSTLFRAAAALDADLRVEIQNRIRKRPQTRRSV